MWPPLYAALHNNDDVEQWNSSVLRQVIQRVRKRKRILREQMGFKPQTDKEQRGQK